MAGKQFQASHRYARISARKVRPLADLVRGKNVVDALSILEYQPQRGAYLLKKVIERRVQVLNRPDFEWVERFGSLAAELSFQPPAVEVGNRSSRCNERVMAAASG